MRLGALSVLILPALLSAGCPTGQGSGLDGEAALDGGDLGGDDLGGDAGVEPVRRQDAGAQRPADPTQAGACSGDEVLARPSGHVDLLTGKSEQQLFCHELDSPPDAVFFTEDLCFRISADGTGTVDFAGGYDASGIEPEGYQRQDSVVDFVWGGLVDGMGGYQVDSTYGGIPIYWQRKGSESSVDAQFPMLYWDEASHSFTNSYPKIVGSLPAQGVTSAACMFLEPTCVETQSTKKCWANGVLDGEYERYDYMGRLEQKGTYTQGEKSGTWTDFTYNGTDTTTASQRRETIYGDDGEDSYGSRTYEGDVLIEEGVYVRDAERSGYVKDGEWKYYHQAPTSSYDDSNATGLLSHTENYDHGDPSGEWTNYQVLYDSDRPTSYTEVDAWRQTRKGIDVCVGGVQSYVTKLSVTTYRGTSWCAAEHDSTCNDPVYVIESSQELADGSHELTCTDGAGAPQACASVTCQ